MPDSSATPALPDAAPLDTTLVVLTPENVAFQFRLAGPALRAIAFLVDLLVIGAAAAVLLAVGVVLGVGNISLSGLLLGAFFLLIWGYGATLEVVNNGQTVGKAALGLRVVSRSGLSINAAQALLRNLIRGVDVAPPFFPGVVAMTLSSGFQRLGDLAAGTIVVIDRTRRHVPPPRLAAAPEEWIAATVPPGFVAGPPLAEALAAYVGRRADLSPGRRTELAGILAARLCAAWETPPPRDPDALVCTLYARAVAAAGEAT